MASCRQQKVRFRCMWLICIVVSVFLLTTVLRLTFLPANHGGISSPADFRFSTNGNLRLPFGGAARSLDDILDAEWVPQLWRYLANMKTRHVSLSVGDSRYRESVVNWLVSALVVSQPPLDSVLVISLDEDLDNILQERGLDSIYVDPRTVLRKKVLLPTKFSKIWAIRFILFRLINHWGFSVATYDSDALVVKSPQSLFEELEDSDLVASSGVYPFDLHRKWNSSTLCMGLVFFRASKIMEGFWDHFSVVQKTLRMFDDQVVINAALESCGIVWHSSGKESAVVGVCKDMEFKVSLLPERQVCRKCRNTTESLYVWHHMGARGQPGKRKKAQDGGMWFLKRNLDKGELKGTQWLKFLYGENTN